MRTNPEDVDLSLTFHTILDRLCLCRERVARRALMVNGPQLVTRKRNNKQEEEEEDGAKAAESQRKRVRKSVSFDS